jgi:hypothetical protein
LPASLEAQADAGVAARLKVDVSADGFHG